ncbi:MBL fold metallo-hydrolase [Cohnella endophytica]|uniref:MBL fold metallo-hydrolase n=1 Tax=Cohnella endophytica TaxID=2419778 RepID=A0A494Y3N8_9BACL|nr:MBL fold metallo-hydrolase [Cohnella endophytica]RKP56911.1 MBL fold metallo-hydrolase [Cohnella endophytica]
MRITFLGNGDSMGTPRVYCECAVCGEARISGGNIRLRSSILIEEEGQQPLLLDCGPDWRKQMENSGIREIGQALLTHAHFDHIGGLTEWADACRWTESVARVYAPDEVLNEVRLRFPWLEKQFKMSSNDKGLDYGDWRITPWKVNHGKNGYSYAYHFEHALRGVKWAYCSDAIQLTDRQKAPLSMLELLVLGTSFVEENFPMDTRSVYDMKEGLLLAEECLPAKVLFTHLSHDVDVREDYGLPAGIALAATGMRVDI